MKKLITLLGLIVSLHSIGQDCDKYILTTTDKMTGKSSTASVKSLVISEDEKTGFSFQFMLFDNDVAMITKVYGAGSCVDKYDITNILFVDDTRIELKNDKKFNCDAKHIIFFDRSRKDVLNQLVTKKIKTVRVWTRDKYMQRDLSDDQANEFMNTIKCLIDETTP